MNVILCGFMGSGKSTIGKLLAKKLNLKFIDLDDYIIEKRSMSIPYIFEKYGEENFRKSETQAVKNISQLQNHIISLGGGTVLNPLNVNILKQSGKIFLLDISAETVFYRLKNDKTRPLLDNKNKKETIEKMLALRLPYYKSAADYIINVDKQNRTCIINFISEILINDKII